MNVVQKRIVKITAIDFFYPVRKLFRKVWILPARKIDRITPLRFLFFTVTYTEYRWVSNQSLNPSNRTFLLLVMTAPILIIGILSAAGGAWPVLFFSILQVTFLRIAFHCIAAHDKDYECIVINGTDVVVETCYAGDVRQFCWNLPWVQLINRIDRWGNCHLLLRSGGKTIQVGQLITNEQRIALSHDLLKQFHRGV
ncbi:MAG: DUF2244 domain-containing protein [Pseudomonadota bacterium]